VETDTVRGVTLGLHYRVYIRQLHQSNNDDLTCQPWDRSEVHAKSVEQIAAQANNIIIKIPSTEKPEPAKLDALITSRALHAAQSVAG